MIWVVGTVTVASAALAIACSKDVPEPRIVAQDGIYSCEDVESSRILVVVHGDSGGPPAVDAGAVDKEKLLRDLQGLTPAQKKKVEDEAGLGAGHIDQLRAAADLDDRTVKIAETLGYVQKYPLDVPNVIEDREMRRRAALLCSCRAERQRRRSAENGHWSDGLIISGLISTAGGGVLSSLSSVADPGTTTQATTRDVGLIAVGVGATATAIGATLKLTDRSASQAAGGADQEIAAAVLLNDSAGTAAWSRAYAICVSAEEATAFSRATEGQAPQAFGATDASSADAADAGAPTPPASTAPAPPPPPPPAAQPCCCVGTPPRQLGPQADCAAACKALAPSVDATKCP